ncbi:MAG: hypothetical protein ACE5HT_10480 [Gemmatimonadales bacterium]
MPKTQLQTAMPRGVLLTAVATFALAACDSGPSGPSGPGRIEVSLTSPNGNEGAAVIVLQGTGLSTVAAPAGQVFTARGADSLVAVVVLAEPGAIIFTVRVDDVALVPSARVVEVAGGDNGLRSSLSGYRFQLTAIPDISMTVQDGQE